MMLNRPHVLQALFVKSLHADTAADASAEHALEEKTDESTSAQLIAAMGPVRGPLARGLVAAFRSSRPKRRESLEARSRHSPTRLGDCHRILES